MAMILAIILDIVAVVLVVLCICWGYRAGFVKTAVKLLGFLLALLLAWGLSGPIADGMYDMFVRNSVQTTLNENLMAIDSPEDIEEGLRQTLDSLPDVVTNLMQNWGLGTTEEMASSVSNTLAETSQSAAEVIEGDIIRPLVTVLLRLLCLIILVILLLILVNILAAVIDKIFKLPVLRTLNGLGGAVLGAAQGALIVLVLVTVLQAVGGAVEPGSIFSPQIVEQTYIIKHIAAINPLTGFVNGVKEMLQNI